MEQESVTQAAEGSAEVQQQEVTQQDSQQPKKDMVSYETYRRTVGEVKALKAKLAELQAQREAEEQARLAEQGKWKEKAELLEKALREKEQKFESAVNSFAKKIFTESAKQVALQVGVRKEAIDDVLKVADFSDVEIGEDFTVNQDQLRMRLEELAKQKPWFFEKPKAQVNPVLPSTQAPLVTKKLEDLSWEELRALAKQLPD